MQVPTQGRFSIVTPRAGTEAFFAIQHPVTELPPSQPVWVTHDAGSTWQRVATVADDMSNSLAEALSSSIYRDGALYALLPRQNADRETPKTFALSTDDGQTWTMPERAPSALERAGWEVDSFAADYSIPHGWYRTLAKTGAPPMLEHSSDDGSTWSMIGLIGTLRADRPFASTFATWTPHQPGPRRYVRPMKAYGWPQAATAGLPGGAVHRVSTFPLPGAFPHHLCRSAPMARATTRSFRLRMRPPMTSSCSWRRTRHSHRPSHSPVILNWPQLLLVSPIGVTYPLAKEYRLGW